MASQTFPYVIEHTKRRKTISLQVKDGTVIITAPRHCTKSYLLQLLEQKQSWLQQQFQKQQQIEHLKKQNLMANDTMLYLGKPYLLQVQQNPVTAIALQNAQFTITLPHVDHLPHLVQKWYLTEALRIFQAKSQILAAQVGKAVESVKVRYYRSKWGSCTLGKHLRYNWLVIQAPESVIDYLVAHEVSHLVHLNHSKAFWQLVAKLCPHYAESRRWLKENATLLQQLYWKITRLGENSHPEPPDAAAR